MKSYDRIKIAKLFSCFNKYTLLYAMYNRNRHEKIGDLSMPKIDLINLSIICHGKCISWELGEETVVRTKPNVC
jgi:hypothetical protein